MNEPPGPDARRLLIVAGARDWGERWVVQGLPASGIDAAGDDLLWVSDASTQAVDTTPAGAVQSRLGSECRLLVFDAHAGFHPDAFAAAAGTLRGGGDCVLLAPPLADWAGFDDPDRLRFAAYPHVTSDMRGLFLDRLQRVWRDRAGVQLVSPGADATLRAAPLASRVAPLSGAQQQAVVGIAHVASGHARRPLVLTADRGRGKSTVLGVAAAQLLQRGASRVTVVAPGRAAVRTLFRHARLTAGLDDDDAVVPTLRIGAGELCFRLPSQWRDDDGRASALVLVDEAAAIPVPWLERLLASANRLVFASTVHGYEGSGRGFALRFQRVLDQRMPQWRPLHLEEPVRWAADDPLERLLNAGLLLDAEGAPPEPDVEDAFIACDAAELAADEDLLRAVFALLIDAHYQTRPSDLRQLLDNPDTRLWLAHRGDALSGVLLGVREGGIDAAMAARILSGERRPRGHLLAQSLAVHAGLDDCLERRILRVQRIAVHPLARRSGVGSRLLRAAADAARRDECDLLGVAYGVDTPLLAFWHAAGFRAARLGVRVDPASATHSLFMLRALSDDGEQLVAAAQLAFQRDLPWALGATLDDVAPALAGELLRGRDCADLHLSEGEFRALARFADGSRQSDTAAAAIWKAVVHLNAHALSDGAARALLLAGILQHHPLSRLQAEFGIAGRAALTEQLRRSIRDLLAALRRDG